ncbi:AbrB/MazE/SpoVT family DNA-binding domain-containing protein [Parashewanella tropica]|uniref:AbrB/MazE/SpoVT family DNA-binding domain-containing protein n=1 Tax=Parashewanella tropica TaxID=2547970 RepID=UPI0010598204|nr:AbrB/MazE/SpoVT family DNA-binding domain-containing protein [Parashewanella tropica]
METTLRTIGNSKGAVIPVQLLKELGLKVGDKLEAITENGRLVITPKKQKKYSLDDLLAKCDDSAPMPQELVDWDGSRAVGEEI